MPRGNTWNHSLRCILVVCLLCWMPGCAKDPAKLKTEALARAERLVERGEYDGAILEYKNALKADPNAANVYYQLGQAYLEDVTISRGLPAVRTGCGSGSQP